jgi:hypothetical protein
MKTWMLSILTVCLCLALFESASGHPPNARGVGATPRIAYDARSLLTERAQVWTESSHEAWVRGVLQQMQTVKVGMTRGDLLKVFQTDGGLQALPAVGSKYGSGRYVSRECHYFKVDVEFELVGWRSFDDPKANTPIESGRDVIRKISKPYVESYFLD